MRQNHLVLRAKRASRGKFLDSLIEGVGSWQCRIYD
jgi:hypothetical protein